MAQWITVSTKARANAKAAAGVSIEIEDGASFPDVILIYNYTFVYREINDEGYPEYVLARVYDYAAHPLPEPEYLMPEEVS